MNRKELFTLAHRTTRRVIRPWMGDSYQATFALVLKAIRSGWKPDTFHLMLMDGREWNEFRQYDFRNIAESHLKAAIQHSNLCCGQFYEIWTGEKLAAMRANGKVAR